MSEVRIPSFPVVMIYRCSIFEEYLTLIFVVVVDAIDKHSSIITHLLSQVRLGMDLTKVKSYYPYNYQLLAL